MLILLTDVFLPLVHLELMTRGLETLVGIVFSKNRMYTLQMSQGAACHYLNAFSVEL